MKTIVIIASLLITSVFWCQVAHGEANVLVGHWNFEQNVQDQSGYGNHGTIIGNQDYRLDPCSGGGSYSMYFDGQTYINVLDSNSLDLTHEGRITFCFKKNGYSDPEYEGIIAKTIGSDDGHVSYEAFLSNYSSTDLLAGYIHDGILGTELVSYSPASDYLNNVWHFYDFSWDGSTLRLEIDGDLKQEIPQTIDAYASTFDLWIGKRYYEGTNGTVGDHFYTGYLDEVKIYSIPEPNILLMLACGGLALLKKRKR